MSFLITVFKILKHYVNEFRLFYVILEIDSDLLCILDNNARLLNIHENINSFLGYDETVYDNNTYRRILLKTNMQYKEYHLFSFEYAMILEYHFAKACVGLDPINYESINSIKGLFDKKLLTKKGIIIMCAPVIKYYDWMICYIFVDPEIDFLFPADRRFICFKMRPNFIAYLTEITKAIEHNTKNNSKANLDSEYCYPEDILNSCNSILCILKEKYYSYNNING